MVHQSIRRRSVVMAGVAAVPLGMIAACTTSEEPDRADADPDAINDVDEIASAENLKQAPMLQEMVDAGEIPDVVERMPVLADIMIQPVHEDIGAYGGTWNLPWTGQDSPWGIGKITEEALFRFAPNGQGVEPNVAKGYDVNDDFTEFTIYLREGMKWSDGEPFTADDVLFWWDHVMVPEIFGRGVYDAFFSTDPETGERSRAEVALVDDRTFTVTFEHPRALFLERLAIDAKWMFAPAHWLRGILDEFVGDEKTDEVMAEYGFADREGFYESIAYYYWIWPDRPSLRAWVPQNEPSSDTISWQRNPYYWKTDPAGNQLPYIDELVLETIQDPSHIELETISGHFDIVKFGFESYTLLRENETKGDYRVARWNTAAWSSNLLQLNMTVKDEALRELFNNIRFREALSIAVDRAELSEILTLGLGEPIQASIDENLPYYREGWANQWAEFDAARSEQIFEEIGLQKSGGWWSFADGRPVVIEILQESASAQAGQFEELLKHYFEQVGIQTNIRLVDRATLDNTFWSNDHVATTAFDVGGISPYLRPDTVIPLRMVTPWHSQWAAYYESEGESGVEPPAEIKEMWEHWRALSASTDTDEIDAEAEAIIGIHVDNQWVLGYTGPVPMLYAVSNDIINVPMDGITFADEFRELGHGRPAQFAFVNAEG